MKANVKKVKIVIPNDAVLNRVNSTPKLKRLSRSILVVGENIENVKENMEKTFEADLDLDKLKQELKKRFADYSTTMKFMAADQYFTIVKY